MYALGYFMSIILKWILRKYDECRHMVQFSSELL
jgi:hypothetical protein